MKLKGVEVTATDVMLTKQLHERMAAVESMAAPKQPSEKSIMPNENDKCPKCADLKACAECYRSERDMYIDKIDQCNTQAQEIALKNIELRSQITTLEAENAKLREAEDKMAEWNEYHHHENGCACLACEACEILGIRKGAGK